MKTDKKYDTICAKQWQQVSADDLKLLYLERDLIKTEIASIFKVSKNQVRYKLKKYDINKTKQMLSTALKKAIKETGNHSIKQLIFSQDVFTDESDELEYGPIKITGGPHKGRIGIFDDDEGENGYVYFGNMLQSLDSWDIIPLRYLDNHITTYDLVTRIEDLSNTISLSRAKRGRGDNSSLSADELVDLYGEYILVSQLLTNVYVETFYLQCEGVKRVFISHSSADSQLALLVASDLKRAKFSVWFDKWDLKLGHSIPQAITEGLDSADALVIILSQNYLKSAFCKDEWQGFYMKYNSQDRPIIIIISDESEPPTLLSSRKYYRLNGSNDYNDMIFELKTTLM